MKLPAGVLTALGTIVVLVGCATPAEPPGTTPVTSPTSAASRLPARPAQLRLNDADPCALLTAAQRATLGVAAGRASRTNTADSTVRGASCLWLSLTQHPAEGYTATVVLNQGAEVALSAEPLRSVNGFAATTTTSLGSDPNHFCGLLVDVAPGQSLSATYSDITEEQPGLTREAACDKAQRLAEAMVTTLRALPPR